LSADPSLPGELALLLACARVSQCADHNVIRQSFATGIDFPLFAKKAVNHGLAGLAGHTLTRVASDAIHEDILDAFRVLIDGVRRKSERLLAELARVLESLALSGVDAIPIKGPLLASRAYGDLGLREFRDLDFLIRDRDVRATRTVLRTLGYEPKDPFSEAQLNIIHRIQGQEVMFNAANGICIEPHTRLTPRKMAVDIDYPGLWSRACFSELHGKAFRTLAPEDEFLMLAVHGGKELWWRMKWVCDVAAYIHANAQLDWDTIIGRAKTQGCLRFVLLASCLARSYFNANIPDRVVKIESTHPEIEEIAKRVARLWPSDEPAGPPSNKTIFRDCLRLHDGLRRRARYALRTSLLPSPHHISWVALPEQLGFAYVPLKIAHDVLMLPACNAYQGMLTQGQRLQNSFAPILASSGPVRRYEEARKSARKSVEADPANLAAWLDLASALTGLKRYREALACYGRALELTPDSTRIRKLRKGLMIRFPEAAEPGRALSEPIDAKGWTVLAGDLAFDNRHAEAVVACDRALALEPQNVDALRIGIRARLTSCDWRREKEDRKTITEFLNARVNIVAPFDHRSMSDSEAEHLQVAKIAVRNCPPSPNPLWRGERYGHKKIRIAYVSTDLCRHAVAQLIVGCFEHHDRNRFETTAISLSANDGSGMRKRIEAAFDRFTSVEEMPDGEVAKLMRKHEIDIAIDLNGHTWGKRPRIFAHRPAPIQVNFLGFPGTMGATFMDYIIADHIVIPEENRVHYSENVAYLPYAYQPNDSKRRASEKTPSRKEAGLPEHGFVFACLNNPSKIRPHMFDVWMRLLGAIDGSVLWLLDGGANTTLNLRREARLRGVDPERLIIAPKMAPSNHLARQRMADLFLDTLPYNAHTTASEALWVGLPVVTYMGKTFSGRVAASVLQAVGLPELVTHSLDDYEQLTLALARDPERLAAIKTKLAQNRETAPLFNTALFTRHLEAAYTTMWQRYEAGQGPISFSVPALEQS
jgi:protein O-GlcNAc transferase